MTTLTNQPRPSTRGQILVGPTGQRVKQLTIKDLTISEDSLRTPYRQRTDENKTAIHWGQRKLHLSEVEFLTIYWDPIMIPNPLCVYAGAAPGTHISLLSEMFPAFTFHLYDPAKFDIKPNDKIQLFNEYFTDEVAARYAGRNDVFFVSDIRTADYKSLRNEALAKRGITQFDADGAPVGPIDLIREALRESEIKNEDQIWGDMNMQQQWVLIINPEHALLKFRLPYALDGVDRTVQYLKGTVYWQIWPPQTSTETRLKPIRNNKGVYELGDWSILEYEQWCFHHNTVEREQTFYQNIFTNNNDPIDPPELLNDYDSTAEAFILRAYYERLGVKDLETLYSKVKQLSRLTTWAINHYRVDEKGAKTLANKRASHVKSSSKAALDAFRAKRHGKKPPTHTAFQHTLVEVNPTWRQTATVAVQQGKTLVPTLAPIVVKPLTPPVNTGNIQVPLITPVQLQPTVPQITPQVPQITPQVPQITPQVPQITPQVPQITPQVPQITPQVPQITPQVPQITPQVPQITPQVPQITPQVPQITPRVPQITQVPVIAPVRTPPTQQQTQVTTQVPVIAPVRTPPIQQQTQVTTPPIQVPVRTPTTIVQPQVPVIAQPQVTIPVVTPKVPTIVQQQVPVPIRTPTTQVPIPVRTPTTIATPQVPQITQVPQVPIPVRTPTTIATPQVPNITQVPQVPIPVRTPTTIATPQVPQVPIPVRTPTTIATPQVPNITQVPVPVRTPTTFATPQFQAPIRTPTIIATPQVPNIIQPQVQAPIRTPTVVATPQITGTVRQPTVPIVRPTVSA